MYRKSLVMKEGLINGISTRHIVAKKVNETKTKKYRTQHIVLVVIFMLLTTMFVLYLSNRHEMEFSVDGNLDDWDGAIIYNASGSPLSSYGVIAYEGGTVFYCRGNFTMLYLYMDTDGNASTGLFYEGLGIDATIKIDGSTAGEFVWKDGAFARVEGKAILARNTDTVEFWINEVLGRGAYIINATDGCEYYQTPVFNGRSGSVEVEVLNMRDTVERNATEFMHLRVCARGENLSELPLATNNLRVISQIPALIKDRWTEVTLTGVSCTEGYAQISIGWKSFKFYTSNLQKQRVVIDGLFGDWIHAGWRLMIGEHENAYFACLDRSNIYLRYNTGFSNPRIYLNTGNAVNYSGNGKEGIPLPPGKFRVFIDDTYLVTFTPGSDEGYASLYAFMNKWEYIGSIELAWSEMELEMHAPLSFPSFSKIIFEVAGEQLTDRFVALDIHTSISTRNEIADEVLELDPNHAMFPNSTLMNFSYFLDAPAGIHGFLTTAGGHFYFEDGTPARFWGVNVPGDCAMAEHEKSDAMADALARAGVNLVRMHAIDVEWPFATLINYTWNDSQHINQTQLDNLDYFIYALKKRGIYTMLNLLHGRAFKPGDGLENTSALADYVFNVSSPACFVYNRTMIELEKKFAFEILCNHTNPYTGLSYANDSAVALIEPVNENGLLWNPGALKYLPEPYLSQLNASWNEYLYRKYGNTENLRENWTNYRGECALATWESIEERNVALPDLTGMYWWEQTYTDLNKSSARRNEALMFLYEMESAYYTEMLGHLRTNCSVKVPVSSVICTWYPPVITAVKVIAEKFDFLNVHGWYWEGPRGWRQYGQEPWTFPYHFSNTPILDSPWACPTQFIKLEDKPIVVGEWSFHWPNIYRSEGILMTTAYALLHDVDAILFYDYVQPQDEPVNLSIPWDKIDIWNMHSDPVRWGVFGIAGKIFHSRDFRTALHMVNMQVSQREMFFSDNYFRPGYNLLVSGEKIKLIDEIEYNTSCLAFASGISSNNTYGNNTIIWASNPARDPFSHAWGRNSDNLSGYDVEEKGSGVYNFKFNGFMYNDQQVVSLNASPAFNGSSVSSHMYTPIGTNTTEDIVYGFYDASRSNYVFKNLSEPIRVLLDAMNCTYGLPVSHLNLTNNIYTSDTGELVINRSQRGNTSFIGTSNTTVIFSGYMNRTLAGNSVELYSPNYFGTFVITAADNKSIPEAGKYLMKLVTVAENTNQSFWYNTTSKDWCLDYIGEAPVLTRGESSSEPTTVKINNTTVVSVYMKNGTWEIMRNNYTFRIFCDTPDVIFSIYPEFSTTVMEVKHCRNRSTVVEFVNNTFSYPDNVSCIDIVLLPDISVENITFAPSHVEENTTFQIYVTVRNSGYGMAENMSIVFYLGEPSNNTPLSTVSISSLLPHQAVNVSSGNITLPAGSYEIYVVAENISPDDVWQSNNTNHTSLVVVPEANIWLLLIQPLSYLILKTVACARWARKNDCYSSLRISRR
jgi:hypothetical protein